MKAKDLIAYLQTVDPEIEIILAEDPEGNGFSPLDAYSGDSLYVPDSTWSGELWDADDEADHEDCDHDEDGDDDCTEGVETEPPEGAVPCVVLWPVN